MSERNSRDQEYQAVVDYLSRPGEIEKRIQRAKDTILNLRSSLTSISVNLSDMPKSKGMSKSRIEETLMKIIGLEEELAELESERAEVIGDTLENILKIKGSEEQKVLTELYLFCKPWERAIRDIGCSIYKFHKLRSKGIASLAAIIKQTDAIDEKRSG